MSTSVIRKSSNRGYAGLRDSIIYTGKTPRQLEHATAKGFLRVCIAKDGTRSYLYDDLDSYMDHDEIDVSEGDENGSTAWT